ncbi:hypothetical protein BGZ80_002842 [Entomortierella chlamydospora]|uniref:Uncharacterized protein n=1 Tax=Entomortierella chlamydospora TaxID=101097 RepID=A0A9P6SWV3_9FUNG|nr:hypothetical protein BGZ80_002842 [Entomortierella chlamydospora]
MYSQSGQPTLSQPFPQMNDKSPGDQPSATASIVPQGADSASSSVRPKEGGLQKRVFASSENNTSTPDAKKGSNVMAPPSPRLHNQKGPAILSVSGQKKASPSVMSSIKKWAIRGGLVYLGYTAVFSCTHNTTGIKGYYCKATNGLGGLAKPYIAPHYNAYIGSHVDRYVKPVTRQGHRIYLKVADPVVQGAVSVAGTVYKSTAKKHVDSVKEQVISILPYPFKPKSDVSKDKDQVSEAQQYEDQEPLAETNDASPQSYVEESDNMQQAIDNEENTIESTKEKVSEDLEEAVDDKDAVLEHEIPVVEATQHQEEEEQAVESESSEEKTEAESHADGQTTEHINVEKDDHQIAQDTNAPEEVELKESEENESGENGQNTLFKREEVEEPTDINSEHKPSSEPAASVELESEPTLTATDEQPSALNQEQEFTTQVEDFNSPAVETVESTPEFADHPTEVPHEEEKAHTETEHAANVAETASQPYETPAEEANNGNAEETTEGVEESQDEIQQQTTENSFIDEQDQKGEHASEEKEEEKKEEKEEEKEEEKKEEHEEEHQGQMQEEGIDSTPGQQADPVSETEHEDHPKAHDEL